MSKSGLALPPLYIQLILGGEYVDNPFQIQGCQVLSKYYNLMLYSQMKKNARISLSHASFIACT